MVSPFSADEKALKKFFEEESVVDWSSPNIIAGEQCTETPLAHINMVLPLFTQKPWRRFYCILKQHEIDDQSKQDSALLRGVWACQIKSVFVSHGCNFFQRLLLSVNFYSRRGHEQIVEWNSEI